MVISAAEAIESHKKRCQREASCGKPVGRIVGDEKVGRAVVAKTIVQNASDVERESLLRWAQDLLQIRASELSAMKKAAAAISSTRMHKVIWPLLKQASQELKRVGWDERSWNARLGWGAVIGTILTVGNTGAGIAALGGAIGVPLWVVLGAGATFAGTIIDEISGKGSRHTTSYTVVDAKRVKPRNGLARKSRR
jgi:hypothetical protein